MATLEEQIRELEARRAKGEVVPQLDALYKKQDDLTRKGYDSVVNPDSLTPGKLSRPARQQLSPNNPKDTPKMRSMPQEEMPKQTPKDMFKGIKEMMAPMGTGGTNVKPRSMNADRDKAYDTDVELKKGGKVSSASKRADGCAIRGKTRA